MSGIRLDLHNFDHQVTVWDDCGCSRVDEMLEFSVLEPAFTQHAETNEANC